MRYSIIKSLYFARDLIRGIQRHHQMEDLDSFFQEAERRMNYNQPDGLLFMKKNRLLPPKNLLKDPFSSEYKQFQMEIWKKITKETEYKAKDNERLHGEFEQFKNCPYPFITGEGTLVGEQYISIGHLLKSVAFKAPCKILEFGPGWGNTTLLLAQMGLEVTAVEIDSTMAQILRYRANQLHLSIEVIEADMLHFQSHQKYDYILFYESFHHCFEHNQLLIQMKEYLSDKGKIIFSGEPILPFPYPWGIRLDGLSLWSMKKFSWMELGFDRAYFNEALHRAGYEVLLSRKSREAYPARIIMAGMKS